MEVVEWVEIQKNKEASNYYNEMKKYEIISNMKSGDDAIRWIDRNLK